MEYIIVWKSHHRNPTISEDTHGFKEVYSTYEAAKEAADETLDNEGPKSQWYFDYEIFQTAEV